MRDPEQDLGKHLTFFSLVNFVCGAALQCSSTRYAALQCSFCFANLFCFVLHWFCFVLPLVVFPLVLLRCGAVEEGDGSCRRLLLLVELRCSATPRRRRR